MSSRPHGKPTPNRPVATSATGFFHGAKKALRGRTDNGRSRSGISDTSARPARRRTCGRWWCSSSACRRRRSRAEGFLRVVDLGEEPRILGLARKPSRTCESSMHWISIASGLCGQNRLGHLAIETERESSRRRTADAASALGSFSTPGVHMPRFLALLVEDDEVHPVIPRDRIVGCDEARFDLPGGG